MSGQSVNAGESMIRRVTASIVTGISAIATRATKLEITICGAASHTILNKGGNVAKRTQAFAPFGTRQSTTFWGFCRHRANSVRIEPLLTID